MFSNEATQVLPASPSIRHAALGALAILVAWLLSSGALPREVYVASMAVTQGLVYGLAACGAVAALTLCVVAAATVVDTARNA